MTWLLIALLSQIYSDGTEQEWGQKYTKNRQLFVGGGGEKYDLV